MSGKTGIKKGVTKSTTKEDLENYINKNMTRQEIADELGVSRTIVDKMMKKFGLRSNGNTNRDRLAKFNIHVFDTIDTEEKAYWLGFLYADGGVVKEWDRRLVCLNLAERDLGHIIKFKNFLEDKRDNSCIHRRISRIKETGKEYITYSYSACNKNFVDRVISLGCVTAKSLILKFPDESIFEKKELVYDFIRGYIDGDGCLSVVPRKRISDRLTLSVLGTLDFLEGIKRYFPQFSKLMKRDNIYSITSNCNKADEIAYKLYEHASIYLDRKYEKYVALCWLHNSETSDKIGEGCDANAEVTPEIAKGSESTVENSE